MRLLRFAAVVAAVALTTVPAAVAAKGTDAECPHGLHCNFVPAAYQQNSADPQPAQPANFLNPHTAPSESGRTSSIRSSQA